MHHALLAQSLTDRLFDATDSQSWADLLGKALEPVLSSLLIIVLAIVASRLARRLLRGFVARSTSTEPGLLQRIEDRTGLDVAKELTAVDLQRRERRVAAISALLGSGITAAIWTIAGLMILAEFGLSLAPLIASAGILGLAIGFGAQDLVKDIVSGLFILAEDQYGVGDTVDVGEASGTVEALGVRTTEVRDVYGTLWHVPNGEIRRVGNKSQKWARSLIDVEVAYDTDLQHAAEIILEAARAMSHEEAFAGIFIDEPEMWGVQTLGASGIALRLVVKVLPGEQFKVERGLRYRLKKALDAEGIEIPFPQRTVWLRKEELTEG